MPFLAINLCLIFKEGNRDDIVSGTLCRPLPASASVRAATDRHAPILAEAHLLQLLVSLLVSLFLLGKKTHALPEIVRLSKRKTELLELKAALEKELSDEETAIDKWLRALPRWRRGGVDGRFDDVHAASHEHLHVPESTRPSEQRQLVIESPNPRASPSHRGSIFLALAVCCRAPSFTAAGPSTPKPNADARLRIVGVRVRHAERGIGIVTEFRKDEARGKPVVVSFDDGGQHAYSWAQSLKKLTPTDAVLEPQSATHGLPTDALADPLADPLPHMDQAICPEQLLPSKERCELPTPGHATAVPGDHTDDAAALGLPHPPQMVADLAGPLNFSYSQHERTVDDGKKRPSEGSPTIAVESDDKKRDGECPEWLARHAWIAASHARGAVDHRRHLLQWSTAPPPPPAIEPGQGERTIRVFSHKDLAAVNAQLYISPAHYSTRAVQSTIQPMPSDRQLPAIDSLASGANSQSSGMTTLGTHRPGGSPAPPSPPPLSAAADVRRPVRLLTRSRPHHPTAHGT